MSDLRDQIAAGPRWEIARHPPTPEQDVPLGPPLVENCAACGELGYVDVTTGTCRACWRSWRFSASPYELREAMSVVDAIRRKEAVQSLREWQAQQDMIARGGNPRCPCDDPKPGDPE